MTPLFSNCKKQDDSTGNMQTQHHTTTHSLLFPSNQPCTPPKLSHALSNVCRNIPDSTKLFSNYIPSTRTSNTTPPPNLSEFPEAFFLNQKLNLYYGTYPSPLQLIKHPFGRPSSKHSFTSEATIDHILIHVFKSDFLPDTDLRNLRNVHPLYHHLHTSLHRLRFLDFRPLSRINKTYASQENIPSSRSIQFLSALLHYDFNVPAIIRYCGNNYTNQHLDHKAIRLRLQNIAPPTIINYVIRSLTIGAPSVINGHTSSINFWKYLRYGNHVSITSRPALVEKSLNKEERNCYTIPFPSWTARFIPNLHVSPSGIIIKPGKKDRIIFDASFHVDPVSHSPNDWTSASDEPPIYYGDALIRHLRRIWNLRITYPNDVIYLWDDDVAGAFRLIKYNPQIATAFAAIINSRLWIPVGQVFGGNTSAQNFEGIARAREYLSEHFSHSSFSSLVQKHAKILDLIQYEHPPPSTPLVKAAPCTTFKGVLDATGKPTNTPHNMFVDDNHIAALLGDMKLAQAASIEGLFQLLGFPSPTLRRTVLSDDKYYREKCSYRKIQLGYLIDTSNMTVSFSQDRFTKILSSLSNFHAKRRTYTLREAAILAGHLEFIASMTPWLRFLTVALKHSILLSLRKNSASILSKQANCTFISDSKLLSLDFLTLRKKNFAISQLLRQTWHSRKKFRISPLLKKELKMLQYIFKKRKEYKFESPIAHLISKDFDFSALGDACLEGAGGFSSSLHFWWYIPWPPFIKEKTLKHFVKTYKTLSGSFISINLLEYATILISYAACVSKLRILSPTLLQPNPTLLIESDNTAAVSWTRKAASSTQAGKSLAFILTSIMIKHQHIGLTSSHLAGTANTIADEISRTSSLSHPTSHFHSISTLKQKYHQLNDSQRFLPSRELLSAIWDALLLKTVPPLLIIDNLGHFRADIPFGENF